MLSIVSFPLQLILHSDTKCPKMQIIMKEGALKPFIDPYATRIMLSLLAAAAKSLQSCPTLCDPIDSSPPGSPPWDSPGKNTGVGCHCFLLCMKVKSETEFAQLCLTPSNPMDCSPPGSSIHGIFQARVLEWGAIVYTELLIVGFFFSSFRK